MLQTITVSELNGYVKQLMQEDEALQMLMIRGEISNFTHHFKTGHFYFSLKDEKCSVKAVMFRSEAQYTGFEPENGMKVIAYAHASLFERDGSFQIYITQLIPDGIGEMQLALEQLKRKLEAQGFFASAHKKPLPAFPKTVGIVTSKTGAALQDILNISSRRCPVVRLLLAPVHVQGAQAAHEIADAIQRLDAARECDVIIVARGGGSREDLWVFHDERIAAAAYRCNTPIVSAIGHEIDVSILDLVADLRAPTPSAAAELVLPDIVEQMQYVWQRISVQRIHLKQNIERNCMYMETVVQSAAVKAMQKKQQAASFRVQNCIQSANQCVYAKLRHARTKTYHLLQLAHSLNPYQVLARGYAMVTQNGKSVHSAKQFQAGQTIELQMQDAKIACEIQTINLMKGEIYEKRHDI